jgi:predicted dehydrogenase
VKQKEQFHYDFSIVGNGSIVQNRLKYALAESKIPKDVIVVDKQRHTCSEEVLGNARIKYATISETSLKEMANSNILWIATPPFAHIEYLSKYINQLFIAIEKPVVTNESELAVVIGLREAGMWNRVFCLSYYYLEKALPLTYLFRPYTF